MAIKNLIFAIMSLSVGSFAAIKGFSYYSDLKKATWVDPYKAHLEDIGFEEFTPNAAEGLESSDPLEETYSLESGQTLSGLLEKALAQVDDRTDHLSERDEIIAAFRDKLDPRRIMPGTNFLFFWSGKPNLTLESINVLVDQKRSLKLAKNSNRWNAEWLEKTVHRELVHFAGTVSSSLWESASEKGLPPQLIVALAEVFAWQIDFNREIRPGDQWRLSVERVFTDDEVIGFGEILAAEYKNRGELYQAVLFENASGSRDYFTPDGQSMRKMFLKSPLKFGRVTSRFTKQRFHPVLKVNRPHNGVDYGAPVGTPVRSVGDGRVEVAGRKGGNGIMVKIRHNRDYQTAYLHLSRIASGVKIGKMIRQGDVIGYVGATGLASGPHLHFSFYERGKFVDPLGRKFPSKDPVSKKEMAAFRQQVDESLRLLPDWRFAEGPVLSSADDVL